VRAINSGALDDAEAARLTGLTPDELRGRSFARILKARQSATP
jgi:hypothetical protein